MIFDDPSGLRWKKVKRIFLGIFSAILLLILTELFNRYEVITTPNLNTALLISFQFLEELFYTYLIVTIILSFSRMIVIYYLAFRQRRRKSTISYFRKVNKDYLLPYTPSVSVVIPVYNESVVIQKTISALLKSTYPIKEILIIDDGSTDNTVEVILKAFSNNPIVKVITKKNGGKSSALNFGFLEAVGEIVVTIDADTIFEKATVGYLVENFTDSKVVAVSGNCKIGNRKKLLSVWQHIEYVTANNLDKRSFEELNAITVVPGSNSAWRKNVVENLGLYKHDTLAEDTELTLRIVQAGHHIVYDERAISYEECPENLKDFIKQRNRWSYGILQAAWKHHKNLFDSSNKPLKYFAIPSLLLSYLLLLTAPVIDFIFIIAILSGTTSIYLFTLLFYSLDFLNSFIAFHMEKENKRPLLWIFIQRFAYRYLLAYVTWKAVIQALRGKPIGWNKLTRLGSNDYNV